jgi:hypothetical protein
MRRRHGFVPRLAERLEGRVVLSHSPVARGLSVVVSGLHPGQQVLNRRQQPIVAEVNQAFDQFKSDYAQARATYFAALGNTSAASDAHTAFQYYTVQRVSLLSQQIISSFLQTPQGASRTPGQPTTLRLLVLNQIINPQRLNSDNLPTGQLVSSLLSSIPPMSGSAAQSQALYSLSQDNAIEAARVTVINGVNIVKNGDFGNKAPHSHH